MKEKLQAFGRLLTIMDELREQCPWDRKQTFESLRNLTIEETYELADALLGDNLQEVKEELGDIMLHMVFYAKIADEKGAFNIADVLHSVCDKLVKRHPHIYGDVQVADEAEVKRNWEQLKLQEGRKSVLEGVPQSLPAMIKAYRMQEKVAQVGFDWNDKEGAWDKLQEEMLEFNETLDKGMPAEEKQMEFGDMLFSLINVARFYDIDPETALERVNQKFRSRFSYIEAHADKPLPQMGLEAMDALWDEAKSKE